MKKKKRSKKNRKILFTLLVFISVAASVLLYVFSESNTYIPSDTFTVTRRDLVRTEGLSGFAFAEDLSYVICDMDYPVSEVYVKRGDHVNKGDRLFSYDSSEIDDLIAEYEQLLQEYTVKNDLNARKLEFVTDPSEHDYKKNLLELEKKKEDSIRKKIEELENKKDSLTVFSDYTGTVSEKNIEKNMSYYNQTVIVISDQNDILVRFSISADKLHLFNKDMKFIITTDADRSRELTGYADEVNYDGAGSYSIDVHPDEESRKYIRDGMSVYAVAVVEEYPDTLAVPYESILRRDGVAYVIVSENGEYIKKAVTEKMDSGYFIAVSSDELTENSVILADAGNYLE